MFDAYTVKKVIPRLVIAAIIIQLSWPIFTFLIYLTGQIAWGIEGLLYAPFGGSDELELKNILFGGQFSERDNTAAFSALFLLGGAAAVGTLALGALGLISIGITILLALLIAFFVLAIRQVVLIILLVTAPIAIAAWILPNTEKIWKIWWESFSKLLLMYPMIILLIAGGKIAAALASGSQINTGNEAFTIAIVVIAFFGPYFLIPATFKLAGSAFANIAGVMNDRSRGAFDRLRNFRGNQVKQNWAKTQAGNRFRSGKEGSLRSKINTGLQGASMINRAGFRPRRMRENMRNAIDDARWEHGLEAAEKIPGAKAFFANDDAMQAGLYGNGDFNETARILQKRGYAPDQARLVAAQALRMRDTMGAQAFGMAALTKLPATGTAYKGDEGTDAWLDDILRVSNGNKSIMASAVAAGKSGFRAAGQYQNSEAGFSDVMEALDMRAGRKQTHTDQETGRTYTAGETAKFIHDKAYAATGAQGIVNARNADSAKALARAAVRDVEKSVQSGDDASMARAAAQIEGIRESSGHGKRVVTDAIIETLTGATVPYGPDGTMDVYDFVKTFRESDDPNIRAAYAQAKKEFNEEAAAAQANQGNQPPRPGQGGPGLGLTGGGPSANPFG